MRDASVLHAHHIIPVACGGTDADENLIVLCPNHHALAHRAGQSRVARSGVWAGPTTAGELLAAIRRYERQRTPAQRIRGLRPLLESLRSV